MLIPNHQLAQASVLWRELDANILATISKMTKIWTPIPWLYFNTIKPCRMPDGKKEHLRQVGCISWRVMSALINKKCIYIYISVEQRQCWCVGQPAGKKSKGRAFETPDCRCCTRIPSRPSLSLVVLVALALQLQLMKSFCSTAEDGCYI